LSPETQASPNVSSIDVGSQPEFAAYDTGNGYVYVANEGSNNVSVINGTKVVGTVSVGTDPAYATYDSGNGYVYVSNWGSSNVSVINGTSIVGAVNVGQWPVDSGYDSGSGLVYVSNYGSANVSVINGTKLVHTVSVGAGPRSATYDSNNGFVYVSNGNANTVSILDGTKLVRTVTVGNGPDPSAYDSGNGYVYVPCDDGTVGVINATKLVATLETGDFTYPWGATYDAGNGYIYVTNSGPENISVIDGTTLIGSLNVGTPDYASYDSGNGYLYVTNLDSANVSVIHGTTLVGWVNVGTGPDASVYDSGNGYVYVLNRDSNTVSVLTIGYPLTFMQAGLPPGTEWWVNITGGPSTVSTGQALSFNESYGTYSYTVSTTAKNYSAAGGTVEMQGMPMSFSVSFSLNRYPANFLESGLPAGTNWSISIGVVTLFSTTATIQFEEPNGTHAYEIGRLSGWHAGSYSGSITMSGGASSTTVAWLRVTYAVNFTERGLPAWTEWWVNVTSEESTNSVGTSLTFSEANGTFSYTVATLDKAYSASGGSFVVNGLNVIRAVAFSAVNYTVTFTESGLPSATGWWINVTGGLSTFSTTESLSFGESNGSYAYTVATTNLNYSAPRGSFVVDGQEVSKTAAFALVAFPVTFTESGLPSGTTWSVTFNNTKQAGTENLEFVAVRNGSYAFTIGTVAGYTANRTSGTVTVHGGPASEPVTFAPTTVSSGNGTGPATFLGLPSAEGYAVLGGLIIAILVVTAVMVLLRRRGRTTSPEPLRSGAGDPPGSP
jgi:YVTN family beta-propeller protein